LACGLGEVDAVAVQVEVNRRRAIATAATGIRANQTHFLKPKPLAYVSVDAQLTLKKIAHGDAVRLLANGELTVLLR